MQRTRVALVLAAWAIAGCHSGKGGTNNNGGGGEIFNPCVPNPQPGYDPASRNLPGCCSGASGGPMGPAHCVPNDEILPTLRMALMACDANSTCMPDPIIKGGGKYNPPTCTSSIGKAPGVCLSQCIPLVSNNPQAVFLSQDGCGDGELCVPCKSPTDHTDTGACEIVAKLCGGVDMAGGGTTQCPYTGPPLIDPTTLPECSPTCGGAHCLPASAVPSAQQSLLSMCTAKGGGAGFCAPDTLITTGGNFVPKTCTSVAGAEGRCLSTCLPSVSAQADLLPLDVCGMGEKCVPCYNPTASDPTMPTGACNLACDKPTQPPVVLSCPWTGPNVVDPSIFPDCSPSCGGAHCVPSSLVPASEQGLLAPCNGGKGYCAPDKIIAGGGQYVPKKCVSVAGVEGRCISSCLPSVASQASLLPKDPDVCDAGEVCAPCFNPTASDYTAPTGACNIACDKPTDPPTQLTCPWTGPNVVDPSMFPACSPACAGAHCLPASLVPVAQRSLLAACGSGATAGYCAPDPIIASDNNFVPTKCKSVAGVEGRCMSTCIPSVGKEAGLLPTDVCQNGDVCAPCYDPTSTNYKTPTGACNLGCDMPKDPPTKLSCPYNVPPNPPVIDPAKFPSCTGGACQNPAHCLPAGLVPPSQQALLAPCGSGATAGFCAPDQIIQTDNHWNPKPCVSIAGAEGRCLSTCLPPIAAEAKLLPADPGVCSPGEVCAPCFNPTASDPTAPTGACSIGCDAPTKDPVILTCNWSGPAVVDPTKLDPCSPACAGAHCLPAALVPPSQRSLLAACGSGANAGYCAPDTIIQSDDCAVPKTCTSVAGAEGRCLSLCLPIVAQASEILPQGVCGTNERCVPCYNPASASPTTPTMACSVASCNGQSCDSPKQKPVILTCPWTGPAVISPTNPGLPDCNPTCAGAHCLPAAFVPPAQQGLLAACGSGATAGYCTPDTIMEAGGEVKPPSCTAFSGVPASEGRCLSSCLQAVSSQPSLEQSTCAGGEKCAPCTDPISGKSTGACTSSSCDAPAQGPYTFPYCCNTNEGRCVPKSQVPSSLQSNLQQDSCADSNYLCVPNENLPGGAGNPTCSAWTGGGRCYSNCLNLGLGQIFPQGDCPADHTCVPCWAKSC